MDLILMACYRNKFQDDRSLYESLPHQEPISHDTSFDISMENLEESLMDLSLKEDDNCYNVKKILPNMFGIEKYSPPPLLCCQSPPEKGTDDIQKLRELLNDILIKLGRGTSAHQPAYYLAQTIKLIPTY